MSEEEKEAINNLKKLKLGIGILNCIPGIEKDETDIKAIDIVLNLIEKQEKELKKLKKQAEISAKAHIELTENLDATIKKQEKVIDEMTIYINKNIDVISKDIEGSICCHNKDGKCVNRKCVECVKKYFYKEVENNERRRNNRLYKQRKFWRSRL